MGRSQCLRLPEQTMCVCVCVCRSQRSGIAEKRRFTFLQLKTAFIISNSDLIWIDETLTLVNQSEKPSNGSKIHQCLDLCVNARLQWSILTWIIIYQTLWVHRQDGDIKTANVCFFFLVAAEAHHVTTDYLHVYYSFYRVSDENVSSLLLKLNWCSKRGAQLKYSCKSGIDSAIVCEWGSLYMHKEQSTIEAAHFISMFLFHLQESTKANNVLGVNFQIWVLNPIF